MRHTTAILACALLCISFNACDNGISKQTLPDGSLEIIEGSLVKGVKKIYSRDGALLSNIEIKDSMPNGMCVYYYSNGKAKSSVVAHMGKKDGVETEYYITGEKSKEVSFHMGKRNGKYRRYYRSGKLKSDQTYAMSKGLGDLKEYAEDGSIIPLAQMEVTVANGVTSVGKFDITVNMNPVINTYRLYAKYPIVSETQPYKKIRVINGKGSIEIYRSQLTSKREVEIVVFYKTKFDNEYKVSRIVTLK